MALAFVCFFAATGASMYLNTLFITFISNTPAGVQGVTQEVVQMGISKPSVVLDTASNNYCFVYPFREPSGGPVVWRWNYSRQTMDSMSRAFGLPQDYFQPYRKSAEVIAARRKVRENALFTVVNQYIVPDYNGIVREHRKFTKPLHDMLTLMLPQDASKEDKLEIVLKFCQDLPYRMIGSEYGDKIIEGIYPPALSLRLGYGDCDTKAMLFASILSHDPYYDMVLIIVPNHMLMAVKGMPKPYQEFIEYKGEPYILCQPVGPARLRFGDKGSNYRPVDTILPIEKFAEPNS